MKFLIKLLLLNIPFLVSLIAMKYTNNPYYLFIAFEFNILFIAGMDNAISVISDGSKDVKAMFIELLEKLGKKYDEGGFHDE